MNYYYLAASLPMLFLGRTPPISEQAFLALCREHLAHDDRAAIEALLAGGPETAHSFVLAWRRRETGLRNAIAQARAARRGQEATAYLRPGEPGLAEVRAVADAFGRATPAEREFELDRFRWQALEAMAGMDIFSGAAVLAYGLRLKLAHRWAAMVAEAGRRRLEESVEQAATVLPQAEDGKR